MVFSEEAIQLLSAEGYTISADKTLLQTEVIVEFLHRSYWGKDTPTKTILTSIENSICFGVYYKEKQIGFARVISDKATFAYLADVFILEEHRKKGLSKWLVQYILAYHELQGLRRWMLATLDAHDIYKQFGFAHLYDPSRYLEVFKPDLSVKSKDN
jgi:GNAT superfamily N-acetyltransferase